MGSSHYSLLAQWSMAQLSEELTFLSGGRDVWTPARTLRELRLGGVRLRGGRYKRVTLADLRRAMPSFVESLEQLALAQRLRSAASEVALPNDATEDDD